MRCSAFRALLPLNPQGFAGVAPDLAFNTAASFTTNTNWQAYSGESTMSYFTQMAGLAYHNFVSAAVGMAVAIAFIRGIAQKEKDTLGNFWVDMVRATVWVLLPIAIVGSLFLVSQGVVQNLKAYDTVQTVEGAKQVIAQGPAASQEVIKQFGTNGGGFFNANSAHPFENPTPLIELPGDVRHLCDLLGADLHPGIDDRFAPARMGGVGGDGVPLPGRRDHRLLGGSRAAIRCWHRRGPIRPRPRWRRAATWKARKSGSASRIRRCSPR